MKKIMTGFSLKILGVISMIFDHIAEFFAFIGIPNWFHWVGRVAAPIFLFESAEGFTYTSDRKKYMLRLLYGFWTMNLINFILNSYFSLNDSIVINNIFGTLFLSTVYMQAILYTKKENRNLKKALLFFISPLILTGILWLIMSSMDGSSLSLLLFQVYIFVIPNFLMAEGGFLFILLAVLFYIFHDKKLFQILSLASISFLCIGGEFEHLLSESYQWMMFFAAIPIYFYNGEKGKSMKNFFYIFYPAHIVVFAIFSYFLQK